MKKQIYLDYNATTPMDPRVLDAMIPYYKETFGNPSSQTHAFGWLADNAVNQAREKVAKLLGASQPESIIFTAGTTESNNMILKGVVASSTQKKPHIITQKTEHGSVLKTCEYLEQTGCEVTFVAVDDCGLIDPNDLRKEIRSNTVLVSIMHANNECGTVLPIRELAAVTHEFPGVLFHSDAAQSIGKLPIHVENDGMDFLSFTAHKVYGPKGVGGLYIAPKARDKIIPLIHGGGHEFGLRSGTHNVAGIVGLAKAFELCAQECQQETLRQIKMRDYILSEIQKNIDYVFINGHPQKRLPNNANVSIGFVSSADLIAELPHLAFSTSSACSSHSSKPSHVIMTLTRDEARAKSAMRLSVGRFTTEAEVKEAVSDIITAVKKIRSKSLEYEMQRK